MCIEPPLPPESPPRRPVISAMNRARIGAAGEQMAMMAVGGDELVGLAGREPHADDDRLLADIEMAEAADQAHAEELAGLFLETADEQHGAINVEVVAIAEKIGQTRLSRPAARRRKRPLFLPRQMTSRAPGIAESRRQIEG